MLLNVVPVATERLGRGGNIFAHALLDLPPDAGPREAIRAFGSPEWAIADTEASARRQQVLPELERLPADGPLGWDDVAAHAAGDAEPAIAFRQALAQLIGVAANPRRTALLVCEPHDAARLLWSLFHCLPRRAVAGEATFSTFSPGPFLEQRPPRFNTWHPGVLGPAPAHPGHDMPNLTIIRPDIAAVSDASPTVPPDVEAYTQLILADLEDNQAGRVETLVRVLDEIDVGIGPEAQAIYRDLDSASPTGDLAPLRRWAGRPKLFSYFFKRVIPDDLLRACQHSLTDCELLLTPAIGQGLPLGDAYDAVMAHVQATLQGTVDAPAERLNCALSMLHEFNPHRLAGDVRALATPQPGGPSDERQAVLKKFAMRCGVQWPSDRSVAVRSGRDDAAPDVSDSSATSADGHARLLAELSTILDAAPTHSDPPDRRARRLVEALRRSPVDPLAPLQQAMEVARLQHTYLPVHLLAAMIELPRTVYAVRPELSAAIWCVALGGVEDDRLGTALGRSVAELEERVLRAAMACSSEQIAVTAAIAASQWPQPVLIRFIELVWRRRASPLKKVLDWFAPDPSKRPLHPRVRSAGPRQESPPPADGWKD